MLNTSDQTFPGLASRGQFRKRLGRGLGALLFLALFATLVPARAEDVSGDYLRIYFMIQKADSLNAAGRLPNALAKFQEARTNLAAFQRNHVGWNDKMVGFRLGYCDTKIAALAAQAVDLVQVVDPGTEPRKMLRLHSKVGDKQSLSRTAKTQQEVKLGEESLTTPDVAETTVDIRTTGVSASGDISFDWVWGQPGDFDPSTGEVKVQELKGTGMISSRGFVKGVVIKALPGVRLNPQAAMDVEEKLMSMAVQLPAEPVGVGAKWQVKSSRNSNGGTVEETRTLRLVSSQGEQLVLKAAYTRQAANQKMQGAGGTVDVATFSGKGTFDATQDLGRPLPREVTVEELTEMSVRPGAATKLKPMTINTDAKLQVKAQ